MGERRAGACGRGTPVLAASLALLALSILLGGCGGAGGAGATRAASPAAPAADPAIAVRAAAVERRPMSSVYATSATLRADKEAVVTARTRGVIRRLLVEEGDRVSVGQEMAILEDDEQRIEFERSRTAHETKAREYERARKLHEQGLTSDEEYEAVRREAEETRHAAALSELSLRRTVIRAPFAGVVLRRHLDVGATVSDGSAVYDVADLSPLYADVHVPERHVERLAPGQRVRVAADASGVSGTARIERIAPLVDASTGTVKVTLAVDPAEGLRPGGFARVSIITETHESALVVPRSALIAEGRRWHVFRLDAAGERVERVEVGRGFEEQDRVEILGVDDTPARLAPGDRVVHVGASALSDGSRVEVVEREAGAEESGGDEGVAS